MFRAVQPNQDPEVVQRLNAALSGRYHIEREIGAGGMATVYLAHDQRHDRRVALKVLRPELAGLVGAARFLQEIRTTANLQHPHILSLHDSGEIEGTVFYVMPLVDGDSLRARLNREKQLPVDDALRIATDVAGALDYAHRHGVIHRDIKPENVLLQEGSALVADFGIALAAASAGGDRLTETGLSLGTPAYMSPEQALGERDLTARSDVFSLGCVVYEMLVGEPPFAGPTAQAVIARTMSHEPRPPSDMRRSVPAHVDAAILRALEKVPADRWGSAGDFTAALNEPASLHAARPSRSHEGTDRGGLPTARSAWVPGVALAVGLILGLVAGSRVNKARANVTPEPRRWSIVLPDSSPMIAARDHFGIEQRSLAISRDGRKLVYVSPTTTGTRLSMVRLDLGTTTALRGTDDARLPAFSPDGRFVAFVASDSEVRKVSLDDGTSTHVTATTNPWSLAWLDDDQIYFSDADCPRVVTAAGGPSRPVGGMACRGEFLGSSIDRIGTRLDWLAMSGPRGLQILSTASGEVRPLTLPGAPAGTGSTAAIPASSPQFAALGFIAFVRDSTLFAAPFDLSPPRFLGQPQAVFPGIRHESVSQHAQMDVSSDGTLVWAPGGYEASARFVWTRPDGTPQDTAFVPPMVVASYALSPDGHHLAIGEGLPDGRRQLVIADLERRVLDRIDYPLEMEPTNWVHGGRAVAVRVHRRDGSVRGGLVTPGSPSRVDTVSWGFYNESPDGTLRCRDQGGVGANTVSLDSVSAGVVVWRSAGDADSTRVAAHDGGWCRFSPNGRFVSWVSPEGLFVAPTDRRALQSRVQVAPAGADEPRWRPDGRAVIYRRATRWYEVPVPGADLKPVGAPRVLFQGAFLQAWASWELGPDGRFLLLQGERPIRLARLNVMTGFPRFLQERLAKP